MNNNVQHKGSTAQVTVRDHCASESVSSSRGYGARRVGVGHSCQVVSRAAGGTGQFYQVSNTFSFAPDMKSSSQDQMNLLELCREVRHCNFARLIRGRW